MNRVFPEAVPDIALVATALADQSRSAMCAALMDGRAWTAGELGTYCQLSKSTTSKHIDRLVGTGVVTEMRQGRHRYLRLASEDVAAVIEQLGVLTTATLPTPTNLRCTRIKEQIRVGRTCYKHLAGQLGVGITQQLRRRGFIDPEWQLTDNGRSSLATWGLTDLDAATARPCMDSTERRFHLAGPVGTQLCSVLLTRGWVERIGATRAVRLTATGQERFAEAGMTPLNPLVDQQPRLEA